MREYASFLLSTMVFLVLFGCGSSDSSITQERETVWEEGVFEPQENFQHSCQNPRSGTDPYNNNQPYPDEQGSLLDEKNFLRSWSNNTYLWYDEITDRNPADFGSPIDYFDILKTFELTSAGTPKDKFHFTYDTAEYNELVQSGTSAGYGAEWAIIQASPPRQILIAFVEPGTPAAAESLARGTEILEVDGVDVVNDNTQAGVDVINAALFPSDTGESHTFVVRDSGASESRTVTLTTETISSDPVLEVSSVDTANGKVGYILFNTFNTLAEEQLFNAFAALQTEQVDDLVLDLRYNGGGYLAIASQLGYMIAGSNNTAGRTFNLPTFNDKHPDVNPVTGQPITATPFYDETLGFSLSEGQSLPSLNLDRVFILSTDGTCSASEAVINGLRGVGIEVILVGGTTCGKPYGFYQQDNCGTSYFTIQLKAANEQGFGDYSDGFSPANTAGTVGVVVPGCSVADDFGNALGDSNEALFATALDYRETAACPAPTGKNVTNKAMQGLERGKSLFDSKVFQRRQLLKNNQFIYQPEL